MQQRERKYFGTPESGLDADSADFAVSPNSWINMENCRTGTTDAGVIGTIESIGSTTLLSEIQPSVSTVVIGSADDTANERILYFVADLYANNDKILCYYINAGVFYTVLLSSQVVGGLNFDKDSLIHSCRIVNGLLFWTDFLNQPRRINIDAAIKLNNPSFNTNQIAYIAPIEFTVTTIIRKPPNYTINIQKKLASDVGITLHTNQIKNNAFYFTYFYTYWTGEESTLAAWSLLAPYNYPTETNDIIKIQIPVAEEIIQDVRKVTIVVIYAIDKSAFEIKIWDKTNSTDLIEIQNHNNAITPLTYYFANNETGNSIAAFNLSKNFDSVPLLSKTLERANNRLFLANNLVGYNTPTITSLTAIVIQVDTNLTGVTGANTTVTITYTNTDDPFETTDVGDTFLVFNVPVDGTHPAGWYLYNGSGLDTDITNYTYIGPDQSDAEHYIYDHFPSPYTNWTSSVTNVQIIGYITVGSSPVKSGISILKSDSARRLGIVFYDQFMRQCGVVLSNSGLITIPDRAYNFPTTYNYSIQWNLSNTNARNEIPDFAYYYSIVSNNDLIRLSFIQARAGSIVYATKDTSGNYVFTSTTYADTNAGIAVKLDILNGYGLGYIFNEGDILKIYISGDSNVYQVSVIGQSGDWAIGSLINLGNISGKNAFFEIYTPQITSASQFYYEQGNIYPIINPNTDLRSYLITQGLLGGDIYLASRGTTPSDYIVECMSPNDNLWKNWFTNSGRLQVIDKIGQQLLKTSIRWSNTFIEGTVVNGLSTFDALDQTLLPVEVGATQKLQITSKVQKELGIVMLCICENETASLYLGEVQQYGSNEQTTLTIADKVIGTINILKGSYGTLDPSSVVEFRGNVFWLDRFNGKVIQYSANGLFPISNYKMTRFWKLFSDQFNSMTQQQIEDLGNRPFVFATVDPHHMELLISIPKLLNVPPKGMLPDYPFKDYPFDIWDGKGKTIVYKLNQEPNHWQGAYRFVAENFITIQNKLFSFKNGQLYLHNSLTSQCVFYGTQDKARIMCLSNMFPQVPKSYNNMTIQANMKPPFVYMYNDYPYQQSSDLINDDFVSREGIFYSPIYRNKLIPTQSGYNINGLLTGEKMRAESLKIMLEFDVSQKQLEFRFLDLGFSVSSGHQTI